MRITDLPPVDKALRKVRRQGFDNTLHQFGIRAINAAFPFRILLGVHVDQPDNAFLACPPQYTAGFLTPEQLHAFAADAATELSSQFIEEASGNGDQCYAICDGPNLAAYGWYSRRPTPIGPPELLLHFDPHYVYMYKGFTDTRYRGQRLHAIGMTRALRHYLGDGYGGIVSYVESTNIDSLKSCFRMGYQVFGSVYLVRVFGRQFAFSSPGCRRFDFRVASTPPRAR